MKCKIEHVSLAPKGRRFIAEQLLKIEGIGVDEVPDACYCALPLTGVPEGMREALSRDHDAIKACITGAGLRIYDPKDAGPNNPWVSRAGDPRALYDADTLQVAIPQFFEFTNVAPSTGAGIEQQKAIMYNKKAVIIVQRGNYMSRMSTGARRCVLVEYRDMGKDAESITGVFRTLREYEPGVGVCSVHGQNMLIGFKGNDAYCMQGLIDELFPRLRYDHSQYTKK